MSGEKVFFGEEEHEIQVSPITLVFNTSPEESTYMERIMITPEMTLDYYRSLREIDYYTARFFKMAVPDFDQEVTKENINKCVLGFQHLIGLFSLSLNFMLQGVKFGWKYPESYLHPKYQANLADILIAFSNKEKFIRIILDVKEEILRRYK